LYNGVKENRTMSGVILLSGGIDSTSLLVWLLRRHPDDILTALHIDYGQKAFDSEARANEYFCGKYGVPLKTIATDLRNIAFSNILQGSEVATKQEQNRLEGRNIILISLAATWASTTRATDIFIGYHKEPPNAPFPDATLAAYQNMDIVLRTAYRPELHLLAPFAKLSRLEVFKTGLYRDNEIGTKTFTCYEGGVEECGECIHCSTKKQMLVELGLEQNQCAE
jgi:7-cyano-7-deazaguanine synthase